MRKATRYLKIHGHVTYKVQIISLLSNKLEIKVVKLALPIIAVMNIIKIYDYDRIIEIHRKKKSVKEKDWYKF